ncbi:uncharacterized protein LOC125573258 isoform X2 [Nematostella vectensis]|uniref:uncharacterized protein LOC125573258 isoform X2 n=1 Tax=Nematostella vectensis TaxID=45351 RepID=UPI002076D787|nr:uncharacterized protein LOC125573258 isoform X2 [Nematostella vectensis]
MFSNDAHLSPYMRFGCLSPRLYYQQLALTYMKEKKSIPPATLFTGLVRRELFLHVASHNADLDKMVDNPLSVQFPWEENKDGLERWKKGKTGFPWIDAIMRQLREEGWIHHLARQAVGCFLTRGCLWVSWEEGFKAFDELQLDAEWSLNASNWLWLSCSSYVHGAVPWYCPVEVGKKVDPTGDYIKRYVPEVRGLPSEYVCEPWNAPLSVQKACRCVVGEDYPSPIVDHMEQRMICVQRMQQLSIDLGAKVPDKGCTSVHWFRKDLRLHDNPSLLASLDNCSTFFPIYVLDMESARASKISANRWNFLCECLEALDRQLRVLGSRLFVIRGRAIDVLPRLFHEWSVNRLTFERESEPAGRQRDTVIQMLAEKANVQLLQHNAHLLYDTDEVLETNDGKLPMTFDEMAKTAEQLGPPCPPCQTVDKTVFGACITPVGLDHAEKYGVPQLSDFGGKELGRATAKLFWKGGELEAMRRLNLALQKIEADKFDQQSVTIEDLEPSDMHLSPYFRYGCLSPRFYYHRLRTKGFEPSTDVFKALLVRELFLHIGSSNPDLHRMLGNPVSMMFPWEDDRTVLFRWKQGTTGFPWIDAIMRQLHAQGWIHHLARQAVGCFLTRGCLWVSWEEGFKAFDELQLDAEWSLNAGNWLWLSCSSYVHGVVPWYCPVEVGKKLDPTGKYIRKYVPEVRRLPLAFIYEPWKAPLDVQIKARCVVGDDYPEPVCDHLLQRRVCVERLHALTMSLPPKTHNTMHWFRKDLRLHDNPSLLKALSGSQSFYGVYFLDPDILAPSSKVSPRTLDFLLQCLRDLDDRLRGYGSRLFVIRECALSVLPGLLKKWDITRMSFEADQDPHAVTRDVVAKQIAAGLGVEVISEVSHTIFDTVDIREASGGLMPQDFPSFQRAVSSLEVRTPVKEVDGSLIRQCVTCVAEDHDIRYGVAFGSSLGPKLKKAGRVHWKGGETEGLKRLELVLTKMRQKKFIKPPLSADTLLASDRALSPYMRFGCLSPCYILDRLTTEYQRTMGSKPPETLYTNLLWREFFFATASTNPDHHRMMGNPLALQIPWEQHPEALSLWKQGKTGFPWIDAIMRQLREEGWIHHLARQAVGCFLTRGCLWVSWEEGFKAFDELQLDAEWSLNAGNWLWLSCSSYVHGAVPWYCPVEVGKQVDPTGDYIRTFVPELRRLPTKFLHEPWKAPSSVQREAGCIVGEDYPQPMVNHLERRVVCVQKMQNFTQTLALLNG